MYGNRSPDDILMRDQLDRFAQRSNGQFSVHYTVDEAPPGRKHGVGFVGKEVIQTHLLAPSEGEHRNVRCSRKVALTDDRLQDLAVWAARYSSLA